MKEVFCPNCFGRLAPGSTRCPCCGFDLSASDHVQYALPPFTVLNNRYMLGRTLGAGGFGITYLAYDTSTGSRVALKEYFPSSICIRNTAEHVEPQRYQDAYEAGKQKFYNGAVVFDKDTNIIGMSGKIHLVPFAEYIPFMSKMSSLN